MKSRSLTRQAVSIVLVAQIVCALVLSATELMRERHSRIHAFDVRLQGRSDSLLGAIQDAEDPDDNVVVDPAELRLPTDDVYAVYNQGGRLLGTSRNAPAELLQREGNGFRDVRAGNQRYRVYQRDAMRIIDRAEYGGVGLKRPVTIIYASPERHIWHEVLEAAGLYVIAICVVAVLTGFVVAFLLRRALRPVSDLTMAAGQISPASLAFTAPQSALTVEELRPLAEVLATAVAGLRRAFEKQHQFVGDAAHELKTAVAVVRSTVQVLMMRPRSTEEYASGLTRVLEDTDRVEGLVSQMLQLARLEEAPASPVPLVDLQACASAALAQLDPVAHARGISLWCKAAPGIFVRAPQDQAKVLISNLAMNAIQHSNAGTSVDISIEWNETGAVVLTVEDTGAGIAPDALPHIFERFYREDKSRARSTGGAGLGLAICKSIVDAVGGSIHVDSAPGKGTTVTVVFSKS